MNIVIFMEIFRLSGYNKQFTKYKYRKGIIRVKHF